MGGKVATVSDQAHDRLAAIEYGDQPSVLLIGDGEEPLERGRRIAALAGCRVAGEAGVADGEACMAHPIGTAAVLVELDGDAPGLDALLDRLEATVAAGRLRAVVAAPEALLDPVAARTPHRDIAQLCGASEAERVEALAFAAAPRRAMLHDIGREGGELHRLREEVGRIASVLAALSAEPGAAGSAAGALADAEEAESGVDPAFVRSIIQARRLRDRFFPAGLFADPAWDMLLDLMAARLEGKAVAVSSLCIAAAVPSTTALRWIKMLTDQGLVRRLADPQDGRRVYIELGEETARRLACYLFEAQRLAPPVI